MRRKVATRRAPCTARRADRGVAMIEMALALPLMLVIVFLGAELSRGFLTVNELAQASREASRRVAAGDDSSVVRVAVKAEMAAHGLTATNVFIDMALRNGSARFVTSRARCDYRWRFPLLPWLRPVPGDSLAAGTVMQLTS